MRGRTSQVKVDEDEFGYAETAQPKFSSKKRLDLNDLLRRKEDEKKHDKLFNFKIISGVFAVALVVILILSL